jgi:hypothetical protein
MPRRILGHLRGNAVGYLALFVALGGSSYAAVQLKPGSVHTRTLANRAVTHAKLGRNSVGTTNVANGSLTAADFKAGAIAKGLDGAAGRSGAQGGHGPAGPTGATGATGAQGPAGHDGSASVGVRARQGGSVVGAHGGSTTVPLNGATWTQSAGELDLITGSVTLAIPSSCSGSFGNALTVSVDGKPATFAVAPTAPASSTVTVPLAVGTLTEPDADAQHTLTASFGNSCTNSGADYTVSGAKLDVVKFR